jgi:hypothetical protein
MNAAHAHLILNHLPVLGVPFGLLALLYGLLRRCQEVQRLGLLVFGLTGLGTIPVYLTGLWADDLLEKLPGVSAGLIDQHHDAATVALVAILLLGTVALLGLLLFDKRPRMARALVVASLVLSLAASGVCAWTANLGGQIRHPEIRSDK